MMLQHLAMQFVHIYRDTTRIGNIHASYLVAHANKRTYQPAWGTLQARRRHCGCRLSTAKTSRDTWSSLSTNERPPSLPTTQRRG